MPKKRYTGRNPTRSQLREADRVSQMHPLQQRHHPTAVQADPEKLSHVNTYGDLPEFYLDQPFSCRDCGKREIWLAADQKWYYEEAKGHVDAHAVYCHDCRKARRDGGGEK